jgi:hypothetical protein
MSARLRKYVSWSLIAALLVATMGVSVHQIYCYCAGETSISFFDAAPSCGKTAASGDCCRAELPACCAKMAQKSRCEKESDDGDCTKKTTKVFQLKVKYLVEYEGFKTFAPAALAPVPAVWPLPVACEITYIRKALNKAPPPPSGREIGIRLQTLRC